LAECTSECFFLPVEPGHRFCILHSPVSKSRIRGIVLHVPPFAEELNKCRRMTAVTARALASEGWVVLQIDLLGCGDSSGELAEVDWGQWLHDLRAGYSWLNERFGGYVWLWGIRAGCLLATQLATEIGCSPRLILWAPVLSGRQHLTQFLRLKVAGEMLDSSADRSGTQTLRKRLLAGETIEIAGYQLRSTLAASLDAAELALPPGYGGRVAWMEVTQSETGDLLPSSVARIARLKDQGVAIKDSVVSGSPFWRTLEITECQSLVSETVNVLNEESE
jgi:exosortase A-associated hydrolase 2